MAHLAIRTAPRRLVDRVRGSRSTRWWFAVAAASAVAVAAGALTPPYAVAGNASTHARGALGTDPLGYTGGFTDTAGLIHLGSRHYDPSARAFIEPDAPAAGMLNGYAYATSDPINWTDPSGRSPVGDWLSTISFQPLLIFADVALAAAGTALAVPTGGAGLIIAGAVGLAITSVSAADEIHQMLGEGGFLPPAVRGASQLASLVGGAIGAMAGARAGGRLVAQRLARSRQAARGRARASTVVDGALADVGERPRVPMAPSRQYRAEPIEVWYERSIMAQRQRQMPPALPDEPEEIVQLRSALFDGPPEIRDAALQSAAYRDFVGNWPDAVRYATRGIPGDVRWVSEGWYPINRESVRNLAVALQRAPDRQADIIEWIALEGTPETSRHVYTPLRHSASVQQVATHPSTIAFHVWHGGR